MAINTCIGANGSTGGFMARTRTGNIELAAGQTLRRHGFNQPPMAASSLSAAPSTPPGSMAATSSLQDARRRYKAPRF